MVRHPPLKCDPAHEKEILARFSNSILCTDKNLAGKVPLTSFGLSCQVMPPAVEGVKDFELAIRSRVDRGIAMDGSYFDTANGLLGGLVADRAPDGVHGRRQVIERRPMNARNLESLLPRPGRNVEERPGHARLLERKSRNAIAPQTVAAPLALGVGNDCRRASRQWTFPAPGSPPIDIAFEKMGQLVQRGGL